MKKLFSLYAFAVVLVITLLCWASLFGSSSSSGTSHGRGGYYGGGYSGGGYSGGHK